MLKNKLPWLVAVGAIAFAYQQYELHESVRRLERNVQSISSNTGSQLHATQNNLLAQMQLNQRSSVAGLSYIELVVEGIARKQGLPIERAREAFEKLPNNPPPGWRGDAPGETAGTKTASKP